MTIALPPPDVRKLRFVPLAGPHVVREFDSGERDIDRGIDRCCERHASHRTRVFCAHRDNVEEAYGFYGLSISASDAKYLDDEVRHANDQRAFVPFIYVDFLAVRREFQNRKIGTMLLGNLLSRCGRIVPDVGVFGIALNALTPRAMALHLRYGFRQYGDTRFPLMILPTQSLVDLTRREHDQEPR